MNSCSYFQGNSSPFAGSGAGLDPQQNLAVRAFRLDARTTPAGLTERGASRPVHPETVAAAAADGSVATPVVPRLAPIRAGILHGEYAPVLVEELPDRQRQDTP